MFFLSVKETFEAAHHLPGYNGPCANVHGHRWLVEAIWKFADDQVGPSGIAADFKCLKAEVRDLMPDHQDLNDVYDFVPTAENLARFFCETLGCDSVELWETENSRCVYIRERH